MKFKHIGLIIIMSLVLIFSISALSWAEPAQVVVVRDSSNNLWKMTCNGPTCSAWSSISGQFASQPTLTWDEDTAKYYLYGVSVSNAIWRSSFNRYGTFNDDWVQIPGSSPSPVAATGGGIANNAYVVTSDTADHTLNSGGAVTNIDGSYVICPYDGYYIVRATGIIELGRSNTTYDSYAYIGLNTVNNNVGTHATFFWLPAGTPTSYSAYDFAVTESFSCSSGAAGFAYLNGLRDTNGSTNGAIIKRYTMTWEYHSYGY